MAITGEQSVGVAARQQYWEPEVAATAYAISRDAQHRFEDLFPHVDAMRRWGRDDDASVTIRRLNEDVSLTLPEYVEWLGDRALTAT